jgi:hypothetical protein
MYIEHQLYRLSEPIHLVISVAFAANTLDLRHPYVGYLVQPANDPQRIITLGSHYLYFASVHFDTHTTRT